MPVSRPVPGIRPDDVHNQPRCRCVNPFPGIRMHLGCVVQRLTKIVCTAVGVSGLLYLLGLQAPQRNRGISDAAGAFFYILYIIMKTRRAFRLSASFCFYLFLGSLMGNQVMI